MDVIFVFGSNLAERHGKGAALYAKKHYGAVYGNGRGIQGNSYALPTKDANLKPLSLLEVEANLLEFLRFAATNENKLFILTPVGCGLAKGKIENLLKYLDNWIIPSNVVLSASWIDHLT